MAKQKLKFRICYKFGLETRTYCEYPNETLANCDLEKIKALGFEAWKEKI